MALARLSAFLKHAAHEWQPERRKLYPTWHAAEKAAGAYSDATLTAFRVARSARFKPDGAALLGTPLPLLVETARRDDLEIVDFGGSTGEVGRDFVGRYPGGKYTVVEHGPLATALQSLHPEVTFSSTMPPRCDVFYTSGTLQYLESPYDIAAAGFSSARYAAVFVRNSFCETDLFRIQKTRMFENGSGSIPPTFTDQWISYPHRTISEAKITKIAADRGFRCVARLDESSGVYRYRGAVYGRQLIFLKN